MTVDVKHRGCDRKYTFYVPELLRPHVSVGKTVLCDTKHGYVSGIICDVHKQTFNNIKGHKNIVAVRSVVRLNRIVIPELFIAHPVKEEKVIKQMKSFNKNNRFNTRVEGKQLSNGRVLLTDGYSTYRAAQRLNCQELLVWVKGRQL